MALMAGLAALLGERYGSGGAYGDAEVQSWVEGLMSVRIADSLTVAGSSMMLIPVIVAAALLAVRFGRAERALTIAFTYWAAKLLTKLGWDVWPRPRPDGVADGLLLPQAPSFPSGHALQAVAVYGILAVWWFRSTSSRLERTLIVAAALLVAVVSGLTRIRLLAHYPSDVWASLLFGAMWVGIVAWAEAGFRAEVRVGA
jgi:undecaprenyl-diphosphatase